VLTEPPWKDVEVPVPDFIRVVDGVDGGVLVVCTCPSSPRPYTAAEIAAKLLTDARRVSL
jgi:hypothetical protein